MHRIMLGASDHQFSVFQSGPVRESREPPEALRQLAKSDDELCAEFLHDEQTSAALRAMNELPAPNHDSGLATLRAAEPDLVVSIRYRRILRDSAIAIPRCGVINLHSGILPDYRGVMATFWAILLAMDSISRGCEPPTTVQTGNAGSYFSAPTTADLTRFHAQGLRLVSGNERNLLDFS